MKKLLFTILLFTILFAGCEKYNYPFEKIIGTWKLVGGYDIMSGGIYSVDTTEERMEEYTRDNLRIRYDYRGNEISRCGFSATESVITIYVKKKDGTECESSYDYWFSNDTLKIRNNGGFEFYDEYFIRIE